jgi:hypothetical protein
MRLLQPALAGGSTAEAVAADKPPANPVLDWLALYLPSWGTSVVLHAALIVLATFVAWRTYEETRLPPPWGVALKTDKYRLERRPQGPAEVRKDRSRLPLKREPYAFSPTKLPQPRPGIGHSDRPVDIPVIGIGGGPRGGENIWGDSGPGPGDGTIFEPVQDARRIVYVVDRSGSMTDSLEWYVKPELKRSIGELTGEHAFHVIFYSSGPPVEMPTRRLVEATDRNRRLAFEFIDAVVARDQTDPSEALRRAFEVRPEVIYFLTDGEFDRAIIGLVKQLNAAGHVRVHTIGFLYDGNREVLERIAADSGGWFKFVSERDLAVLGR